MAQINSSVKGPFIGVYGKLGDSKGTFDLLDAIHAVVRTGHEVNLLVMGHAVPAIEARFHHAVSALGLEGIVVQLPFLPHWRVPEFIRGCLAICCLEQDFPIAFHAPIVPREVLLCGGCLVGSTEILRKLPGSGRLVHGYNCVAVEDVRDTRILSERVAAILDDPGCAPEVGRRAREYAVAIQHDVRFPENYELLFGNVIDEHKKHSRQRNAVTRGRATNNFVLTRLALANLSSEQKKRSLPSGTLKEGNFAWASEVCGRLRECVEAGDSTLAVHLDAARLEVQIAEALDANNSGIRASEFDRQFFRLQSQHWAIREEQILDFRPKCVPRMRIEEYCHDVNVLLVARASGCFPSRPPKAVTFAVTLRDCYAGGIRIIVLKKETVLLFPYCDGTLTLRKIAEHLKQHSSGEYVVEEVYNNILQLFELGLVSLLESVITPDSDPSAVVR